MVDQVLLVDQATFSDSVYELRTRVLQQRKQQTDWLASSVRGRSERDVQAKRQRYQRRSLALWKGIRSWAIAGAQLSLAGVETESGDVCEPDDAARILADYWKPIFIGTQIDGSGAQAFLDSPSGKLECWNWQIRGPRSVQRICDTISHNTFDTGVREDGFPYSSYHPIKHVAALFSLVLPARWPPRLQLLPARM